MGSREQVGVENLSLRKPLLMREDCEAMVESAWTMNGNEGLGLAQVNKKLRHVERN